MIASARPRVVKGRWSAIHCDARALLLAALLAMTFLLGGSARADASSLLLLRPLAAAVFAIAAVSALPAALRRACWETTLALALLALPLLHVVPLPPQIWTALPGRELAAESYRAMGQPLPWHPLSLTPRHSWNAVFALLGPIAAFLLALSLTPETLRRILPALLVCGMLSALAGALQILGADAFYFYDITNRGAAVGFFANRNHAAVAIACLLPLLALHARIGGQTGQALAGASAIALVPLVLLTESRAGLVCMALAFGLALWVFGAARGLLRPAIAAPVIVAVAAGLGALFLLHERAPAVLRLATLDYAADLRLRAAPVIWDAVLLHWPWGSGMGSFVEVYQIHEPRALLGTAYLNHAHNDPLELLLTGGLPAALLMAAGPALLAYRWRAASRSPAAESDGAAIGAAWARAGASIAMLLVLASLVDYPLRTPILATLLALAAAFVIRGTDRT